MEDENMQIQDILKKLKRLEIKYEWSKHFEQKVSNSKTYLNGLIDQTPIKSTPSKPKPHNYPLNSASSKLKEFHKCRENLAITHFNEYNNIIFDDKLPQNFVIEWNKRLTKTAGLTRLKLTKKEKSATIELSEKVYTQLNISLFYS
jgi:hypothetical protein